MLTYEDNQGTIQLVQSNRLTDTVRHHAIKLACLQEEYNDNSICLAYTKSSLMVVDCISKPTNGAQLSQQISYIIGQWLFSYIQFTTLPPFP